MTFADVWIWVAPLLLGGLGVLYVWLWPPVPEEHVVNVAPGEQRRERRAKAKHVRLKHTMNQFR